MNIRDPFANLSLEIFEDSLSEYPGIADLFNKRIRRLVKRGLSFIILPRIYQWLIVGGSIAQSRLSTLNEALIVLKGKDRKLDQKIREVSTWESDYEMFRFFTELLVIRCIMEAGKVTNFIYEESHGSKLPKPDINVDILGRRLRIDVTHKEDKYPIEDTTGRLKTVLEYAGPSFGGHIVYAPPVLLNYNNGTITRSKDMTDKEFTQTIKNSLLVMSSLKSESASVLSPNPFFRITINTNSTSWTAESGSGGGWAGPDIEGYAKSVEYKAKKFQKINDSSYKIIAVDFIPGSHLHGNTPYRRQLFDRILQGCLASSGTDEVVTFSLRFENGQFENLGLLWKKDAHSPALFEQIINRKPEN